MLIPPILGSAFRDLKIGDEIKTFTLNDLDGKPVTLDTYKGKFFLINFFQIDKEKSIEALKGLTKVYADFKDKGIAIIAVTADKDKLEDIKKFKDENKIEFPIVIDADKTVYQSFGIFVMPVTALIDKDFKIAYEYSSYLIGFESEIGGRLKVALGEESMEDYKKSVVGTEIVARTDEEKSAVKKLGQAEVLLVRGRPDEALTLLNEVVALDPKVAKAHILIGDALLKKGTLDDAQAAYEKAKTMVEKNDPVGKTADVGLGAIYALKGDLDKAKQILSMAAMVNPNPITSAKAYYWLGFVSEKKNDLPDAVKNYKKAVEKLLAKSDRSR